MGEFHHHRAVLRPVLDALLKPHAVVAAHECAVALTENRLTRAVGDFQFA